MYIQHKKGYVKSNFNMFYISWIQTNLISIFIAALNQIDLLIETW